MSGDSPVTCWIIDHPAHLQLLAGWIRVGSENDLLIATRRKEIESMLAAQGRLPNLSMVRVERPVGIGVGRIETLLRARRRMAVVRRALRGRQIDRLIAKGAALEVRAAKRAGVPERWYLTDTEVNHTAHRLALPAATDVLLPESWRSDLDGGFLDSVERLVVRGRVRLHRYPGVLPDVYVDRTAGETAREQARAQFEEALGPRAGAASGEPVVLHREISGGGIHDGSEVIEYMDWIRNLSVHFVHTKESAEASTDTAWELPVQIAMFDGVLTGSTTLAAEALVHGVPTLLVSAAQRGFLDHLESRYPGLLYRWTSHRFEPADFSFADGANRWIDAMSSLQRPSVAEIGEEGPPEVGLALESLWGSR